MSRKDISHSQERKSLAALKCRAFNNIVRKVIIWEHSISIWYEDVIVLFAIFSLKRQKGKIFEYCVFRLLWNMILAVKIAQLHQHLSMRSSPNVLWDPFLFPQLKVDNERAHWVLLTIEEKWVGSHTTLAKVHFYRSPLGSIFQAPTLRMAQWVSVIHARTFLSIFRYWKNLCS